MPLIQSASDKALEENIRTLIKEGKEQDQAVAIAQSIQRKAKSSSLNEDEVYSKEEYVCQVLPEGDLDDGSKIIPLSDDNFRKTVFESLAEGVKEAAPSILFEHKADGESYGYVTQMFERGKELYAKFRLRKDIEENFNKGKYRWVSPTIAWGFTDDKGSRVPARALEISFVSVPRNATRQIPLTQLNNIGLSSLGMSQLLIDSNLEITQLSFPIFGEGDDLTDNKEIDNMDAEQLKEMIEEVVSQHMDRIKADLKEELSPKAEEEEEAMEEVVEVTEAQEEAVEEEVDKKDGNESAEEDEKEKEDVSMLSELAQANKVIADLKEELATLKATSLVDSDIAKRPHLSSMKEKLLDIAKKDVDLYNSVVELTPVKANTSQMSQRLTADASPSEGNKSLVDKARELSVKEGTTFVEAFKRLSN